MFRKRLGATNSDDFKRRRETEPNPDAYASTSSRQPVAAEAYPSTTDWEATLPPPLIEESIFKDELEPSDEFLYESTFNWEVRHDDLSQEMLDEADQIDNPLESAADELPELEEPDKTLPRVKEPLIKLTEYSNDDAAKQCITLLKKLELFSAGMHKHFQECDGVVELTRYMEFLAERDELDADKRTFLFKKRKALPGLSKVIRTLQMYNLYNWPRVSTLITMLDHRESNFLELSCIIECLEKEGLLGQDSPLALLWSLDHLKELLTTRVNYSVLYKAIKILHEKRMLSRKVLLWLLDARNCIRLIVFLADLEIDGQSPLQADLLKRLMVLSPPSLISFDSELHKLLINKISTLENIEIVLSICERSTHPEYIADYLTIIQSQAEYLDEKKWKAAIVEIASSITDYPQAKSLLAFLKTLAAANLLTDEFLPHLSLRVIQLFPLFNDWLLADVSRLESRVHELLAASSKYPELITESDLFYFDWNNHSDFLLRLLKNNFRFIVEVHYLLKSMGRLNMQMSEEQKTILCREMYRASLIKRITGCIMGDANDFYARATPRVNWLRPSVIENCFNCTLSHLKEVAVVCDTLAKNEFSVIKRINLVNQMLTTSIERPLAMVVKTKNKVKYSNNSYVQDALLLGVHIQLFFAAQRQGIIPCRDLLMNYLLPWFSVDRFKDDEERKALARYFHYACEPVEQRTPGWTHYSVTFYNKDIKANGNSILDIGKKFVKK